MKREISFVFFLTVSVYQLDIFAGDMNEADYMRMIMGGTSGIQNPQPLYDINGLITEIIPESNEYIVGKPMRFSVVLENISDVNKNYKEVIYKPLVIKEPDGNCPYDKLGPYQTMEGAIKTIAAGEVRTLINKKDIAEEYLIIKPGKYTIQFNGGNMLPVSEIYELEVKDGKPDDRDIIIESLINVLPDEKWRAAGIRKEVDSDRNASTNLIVLHRGGYDGITVILVYIKYTGEISDINIPDNYLGRNELGYYSLNAPPEALELWPTIKKDIIKALKIEAAN